MQITSSELSLSGAHSLEVAELRREESELWVGARSPAAPRAPQQGAAPRPLQPLPQSLPDSLVSPLREALFEAGRSTEEEG